MTKEEREKRKSEENTENSELPEKWQTFPFDKAFNKGLKPTEKSVGDYKYITLKRGRYEKSLGAYKPDLWEYLQRKYNVWLMAIEGRENNEENEERTKPVDLSSIPEPKEKIRERKQHQLSSSIKRPLVIPASYTPDLDTLYYYKLLKQNGYKGTFEKFINETVKAYFLREGISPGLIITVEEEEEIGG